jgi:hypothetical protein
MKHSATYLTLLALATSAWLLPASPSFAGDCPELRTRLQTFVDMCKATPRRLEGAHLTYTVSVEGNGSYFHGAVSGWYLPNDPQYNYYKTWPIGVNCPDTRLRHLGKIAKHYQRQLERCPPHD